jgi:hypothetical protein
MYVKLPVFGEASVYLTYTDEFGIDHNASVIRYLMLKHEVDVTIISADKDGLIVELESK